MHWRIRGELAPHDILPFDLGVPELLGEAGDDEINVAPRAGAFFWVIVQIIVIDMVFSLDSIITAIGNDFGPAEAFARQVAARLLVQRHIDADADDDVGGAAGLRSEFDQHAP